MLLARRYNTPTFRTSLALICFTACVASAASADSWTRFRGPNGSGISDSTGLPVEFGPEKNLAWEASVPFGRSSPAIAADRIFLTAVQGERLVTLAVDRDGGNTIWLRSIERASAADIYKESDSATPSPVTDGSNVYAFFHEFGLVSYDAEGNERWRKPIGPFRNYYGIASSPVLAGDKLVLVCDQADGSFAVAVDKDSGAEVWRRNRLARLEAYATPILYPDAQNPAHVLVAGSRWVDAYDVETGEDAWSFGTVGSGPISSPVLAGGLLYIAAHDHAESGWPDFGELLEEHDVDGDGELSRQNVEGIWIANHFGWLDTDASGTITTADWDTLRQELVHDTWGVYAIRVPANEGEQPEAVWNYRKNVPYIPTSLVYDGVFYMVRDSVLTTLDPATGEVLKRDRLGGGVKAYASPVAADGKVYLGTLDGTMEVIAAGADWTTLASNEIGEAVHGTPAILDGALYVRTADKLYRFEQMPEADGVDDGEASGDEEASASP